LAALSIPSGLVTLNAAISLYASCAIETHPSGDNRIKLVSRDIKCEESFASFAALVKAKRYRLPLLAEIVKFFQPQGGFTLTTDSEAPAGAGIGGSSAMAVAICAVLDRFTGAGKSKVDWIHISRDAEAIVINVPTGTQDHYPPAFGGAAAIELPPGGEHRVELRVNLDELERRVVVCYTGKPRQHGINNWEVYKAHIGGKRAVQNSLERISDVAQKMRLAFERPDWPEAGRLMREECPFESVICPPFRQRPLTASLKTPGATARWRAKSAARAAADASSCSSSRMLANAWRGPLPRLAGLFYP